MNDIQTREDLHLLMSEFCKKLLADDKISFIFTEVAKIDLAPHLVDLVDFWEQILFDTGSYRKNVVQIHLDLNQKIKLSEEHFFYLAQLFQHHNRRKFQRTNRRKHENKSIVYCHGDENKNVIFSFFVD